VPDASTIPTPKVRGVRRKNDTTLGWVGREYPQLAAWRCLAVEWLKGETSDSKWPLRGMGFVLA